ncbi:MULTISPECIES: NADH-quinone oxidoreductase subunit M [unclassified Isoptericola]|uniref:NADH-quinone oxidoreductase subunit M n=1 Tax=unclassified Isoptericola TaxID=2623355 RepID=UPI002712A47B|nr:MULTISPECIES: NADH-quinone oxidoreductase subunit M [unclassified Isoptericola]MDO8143226.1 NADH-quinone oxidoreductase subunit M [Isoptericola sp. 178]MDO8147087.1 NADH-quinone oxidoreductase subunit M [Isoptericola sp. b515]MDO8150598.1 NADH-quinone oxidoreductase subunit M [Isoptericola sp. b408]
MSTFPWLTVLVAWPLVAALATALTGVGRGRPAAGAASGGGAFSAGTARTVALVGALVEVALVVGAFLAFDTGAAGTHQLTETYPWIPAFGASYAVGVDGVALLLVALSAGLVPLVILAAWHEQGGDAVRLRRYLATVLVLLSFMVLVFTARDVFLFYVVFEAMLIPAYFLIGGFGQGAQRRYAAVKFLMFSLGGGLIMLAAVVALYLQVPVDAATGLRPQDAFLTDNLTGLALDPMAERLMFAAFFLAFAIKAPMFPVHTWLPDVTQNATPGTSTLLICVLDKVGTFGMLTLCLPLFPEASRWAAPFVVVLAVISILYGAILAIGQSDVLRLIGYTSVSHFGFIILGIFTFTSVGVSGSSFMMLNHGISTGALFLLAGFAIARHPRHSQLVSDYGGMRTVAPVLGGTFLVAGLSALALPGLATFVSEIMVFLGAYGRWPAAVLVAVPAVVLAATYVLLTYQRMFTGPVGAEVAGAKDLGGREKTVAGVLVAALVVLGLVPGPALDYVREPAEVSVELVGATDPQPVLGAAEGSEQ